ncbi:MAG TPA: hypothetical protein VIO32_12370, partial [Candidatus Baltobacteraceae bacterium]
MNEQPAPEQPVAQEQPQEEPQAQPQEQPADQVVEQPQEQPAAQAADTAEKQRVAEERRKAAQANWQRLVDAKTDNSTVEGVVKTPVKGGLLVDI